MIADSIDSRVLAKMEVALERACKILSIGADEDSVRRHIASRILERRAGERTLGDLADAGCMAATELRSPHGV